MPKPRSPVVKDDAATPSKLTVSSNPPHVAHRISEAALAIEGLSRDQEKLVIRAKNLEAILRADGSNDDNIAQILLMKEVAYCKFLALSRGVADLSTPVEQQAATLELALKYGKLYSQLQAELEKAKRQGIHRVIVQNNGSVGSQSLFGDAVSSESLPATTITAKARSPRRDEDV